jgi:hypothetical protein
MLACSKHICVRLLEKAEHNVSIHHGKGYQSFELFFFGGKIPRHAVRKKGKEISGTLCSTTRKEGNNMEQRLVATEQAASGDTEPRMVLVNSPR